MQFPVELSEEDFGRLLLAAECRAEFSKGEEHVAWRRIAAALTEALNTDTTE